MDTILRIPAIYLGSSTINTDRAGLSTCLDPLIAEKKFYNTQHISDIAIVSSKTYLRSVARTIGMDPGNLSRLARKYRVPVDDEAALVSLGRVHQRRPVPEGEYVVDVNIVLEQFQRLYESQNLQFHQRNRKFKQSHEEGVKLLTDSIQECNQLRQFVLQTGAALEPVLRAPWHGKDGINLPAEQAAAIQDCFGDGWAEGFEALRRRQNVMESLIAEITLRPPAILDPADQTG
jgi:predicted transcriptional regulator with HTH domain